MRARGARSSFAGSLPGYVPAQNGAILAAGEERAAVRGEGEGTNPAVMAAITSQELPRGAVPEANVLVAVARRQQPAVGRQGDRGVTPAARLERPEAITSLARRQVPKLNATI